MFLLMITSTTVSLVAVLSGGEGPAEESVLGKHEGAMRMSGWR